MLLGTGDCEIEKCKSDLTFSDSLATDLVSEMVDNAVDIAGNRDKDKFNIIVDGILDNLSDKFNNMKISDDSMESNHSCDLPCKGLYC